MLCDEYAKYFYARNIDYPIAIQTLSASLAKLIGGWNEIFPKYSSIIMILPATVVLVILVVLIILVVLVVKKCLISEIMSLPTMKQKPRVQHMVPV